MNDLQKSVVSAYTAAIATGTKTRAALKQVAEIYNIGIFELQGCLHLAAEEGLRRKIFGVGGSKKERFVIVDYRDVVHSLEQWVKTLEK